MVAIVTGSGIDSDMHELEVASSMNNLLLHRNSQGDFVCLRACATETSTTFDWHVHVLYQISVYFNRNKTVNMAFRLVAGCPKNRDSIPGRDKKFVFHTYHTCSPSRTTSYAVDTESSSWGIKWPEPEYETLLSM
jgi:hypothetical protein